MATYKDWTRGDEQCFTSDVGFGPRGDYYHYVMVKGGKIVGFGKYGDYSNGQDGTHACLKMEYCLTQYSNKTAKLVQTLTQEQFATSPEELLAIRLLMLTNYELGKD